MRSGTLTLLVIFASVWTTLQAQIEGSDFENSVIVSSLTKSIFTSKTEHINVFPGTLYDFKTTYLYMGLKNVNTQIFSLDVDYTRKSLYIFDRNTGAIFKLENFNWENNFNNISLSITHDGLSRAFARISVDWIADNIYWTDPLFGWIVVQSASKQYIYNIIVKDELEKPYALVVSPVHKFLYWSDVGSTVKIERASLSGNNRETIISTGLAFPTSIDIDYAANKIVWVDASRDTVETANLDGTARRVIRRMSHSEFYDVAVFQDMICVTDLTNGSLIVLNKNTGAVVNSITKNSGDPFLAVALYSADAQPSEKDLCENKGCSDICIHESGGPTCLCKEGFKLKQDGLSCEEDLGKFHRAFMWTNATDICMIDIRSLTTVGHFEKVECFYQGGTSISHFDIDMSERKVVFVDGREIYSINIGQGVTKTRLIATNEKITGIALDWRDNNVYWSMGESTGTISIFSQTTLGSFPLIDTNLTYPKDLNILPFHNFMFWISGTSGAHRIERSELSGSKRLTLISGGSLGNPNSLIVDSSSYTLYFIDSGFVKSCDIDGKGLTTLQPNKALNSPKALLTYQNYLIVSDSNYPTSVLEIFEKTTKPVYKFRLSAFDVDSMTDMKVLDNLLQPTEIGPCAILNGDCEHICIPIGRNRLCRCEYGFNLDSNKETCSSTAFDDNFLLVTDWTHNQIYQISLATDDVRAVDTDTHGSPIGIIHNKMTQQVIWSSVGLVHSISLNSTGYKVLLNTEMFGSFADRFSIDYSSGNVYYTANAFTPTGFTGIGVISSEGLHKRLISFGAKPRAIVLDPKEGLLFWTDHASTPAFVKKANMDGSNIQTIVQSGLVWPNGLAIDTEANVLYVTDGFTNVIRRCSYSGVCTNYYVDSEAHLMDIELLGDFLYYAAWNRPYITKLHKTDPSVISRVGYKPELGRLDSISLYHSTAMSPAVSTACNSNNGRGQCSTFCLPTPSGYTCTCEDGVTLLNDGKTCENAKTTTTTTTTAASSITTSSKTTTTISSSLTTKALSSMSVSTTKTTTAESVTTSSEKQGAPVAVIAGGITGIIVLIAIIAVLVIFIVKRRNRRKATDGPVSNQYETGFDISFITPASIQQPRPDTTYDLIIFDDPKSEDSDTTKSTNDNLQNDYMSLIKRNEYEQLSTLRKSKEEQQEFRPSALPNEYHKMSSTARPESSQTLDDYLVPVSGTKNNSSDEDFNDPMYRGDTAVGNNNPFLNSLNQVSTISYMQQN